MLDRRVPTGGDRVEARHKADGSDRATRSTGGSSRAEAGEEVDGAGLADSAGSDDDFSVWDDYVPDPIVISEADRQKLRQEARRYVAELIEEVGEPTPEETARAEAWWRPIAEHLNKGAAG